MIISKKNFPHIYWTFDLIKKQMESYGAITIQANKYNSTCTLTTDHIINLKNFDPVLEFDSNKTISANTATKSDNPVDTNNRLNFIKISCNLMKTEAIFWCLYLSQQHSVL